MRFPISAALPAALLLLALPANAQSEPEHKRTKYERLIELRNDIDAIETMEQRGLDKTLFVPALAGTPSASDYYKETALKEAHTLDPRITNIETLRYHTQGFMSRISGFFTFTNILLVTAGILFSIAICWLCGIYLLQILIIVPVNVYEALAYLASLAAIYAGTLVTEPFMLATVLPGCLGLMFSILFSHSRHVTKTYLNHRKYDTLITRNYLTIYAFILSIAWGAVAVCYQSQVIGFISIAALLATEGFIAGMLPGIIYVGYDDEDYIASGTIAAFMILATHVIMKITNATNPMLEPFRVGMEFLGTFAFYIGLLLLASKYYNRKDGLTRADSRVGTQYIPMQIVTIIFGIAALYLGSVYHMPMLLGVGGWWFYIYALEKYYEIPWEGTGWAWSTLGLSGIIYGMYAFAITHPEYFIFG